MGRSERAKSVVKHEHKFVPIEIEKSPVYETATVDIYSCVHQYGPRCSYSGCEPRVVGSETRDFQISVDKYVVSACECGKVKRALVEDKTNEG